MKITFSGRHALIIGGSCELALALAHSMIASSLFPTLTYRNDKGLEVIHKSLSPFMGKYDTAFFEFGARDSLQTLFHHIGDNLDYLVDFAQGDYESLIAAADEDTVHRYFSENISSRAEMLKLAGRILLKKKKGRLLFVSSVAAEKPNPGQGFYAASKLASEALYRSLGVELGPRGVTTVILRPGYIDAGRGKAFLHARGREVLENVPGRRPIAPEEIAAAILFLLSDSALTVNATAITMDGGLTAKK